MPATKQESTTARTIAKEEKLREEVMKDIEKKGTYQQKVTNVTLCELPTWREWRNLTENVLSECFLMYEHLRKPDNWNRYTDDAVTDVTAKPTWREWCESVGVSYNTFYRHFKSAGWIETKQKQLPTLTGSILNESYLMYLHLKIMHSGFKGNRYIDSSKLTNVKPLEPTWQEWCKSVGWSHMTFDRRFKELGYCLFFMM